MDGPRTPHQTVRRTPYPPFSDIRNRHQGPDAEYRPLNDENPAPANLGSPWPNHYYQGVTRKPTPISRTSSGGLGQAPTQQVAGDSPRLTQPTSMVPEAIAELVDKEANEHQLSSHHRKALHDIAQVINAHYMFESRLNLFAS